MDAWNNHPVARMAGMNADERQEAIETMDFEDTVHEEPQERSLLMGDPAEKLNETLLGVDLETGEILDPNIKTRAEDLPRVARWIRRTDKEESRLRAYAKAEIARISECTDMAIEQLEKQKSFFLLRAEDLMRSTDDKKLSYPGLGTFKFGSTRESVNTELYDNSDDDAKAMLQEHYPTCFKTKTVVTPDKKAIKQAIENEDDVAPGFSINEKRETFGFKAEEDV